MTFQNIKPGDRVRFLLRPTGRGYTEAFTAKVNPLLIFPDHVVVNHGNNGTVVDSRNFIKVIRGFRTVEDSRAVWTGKVQS